MSVQKRRCLTCKHFDDARMAGNGWCTHPKRQVSSDVRILVRKGELACRNSWGGDLWASADADQSAPESTPVMPDTVFISNEHTEDQVTSVRAAGAGDAASDGVRFADPSLNDAREDVIVDHGSVVSENPRRSHRRSPHDDLLDDDGLNLPAQEDQQERARIIARGNRDAILLARERHTQRRKGTDRLQPPLAQDDEVTSTDLSEPDPSDDQVSFSTPAESNPIAETQDTVIANNLRFERRPRTSPDQSARSTPARAVPTQFARTYDDPTPPVPTEDVHDDPHNLVSRRADRDRFETVPEIKPDIELPRIREFLQADDSSTPGSESIGGEGDGPAPLNSYDLVLRRAQAIKSASRAERQGRPGRPARKTVPITSAPPHAVESSDPGSIRANRVNHLPSIEWDLEPENDDVSFTRTRLPDLDPDEIVSGRQERQQPDLAFDEIAAQTSEGEDDAAWPDDAYADLDHDHVVTQIQGPPQADRSRSWWRSLNFGRSRRQEDHFSASDSVRDYEPEDWYAPVQGDSGDVDAYDDDDFETAAQQVSALPEQSGPEQEHLSSHREQRQSIWKPLDEIIDAPPIPETDIHYTDRQRAHQGNAAGRHDIRQIDQHSRHPAKVYTPDFRLNDEQGMDAFRSALFGEGRNGRRYEAAPVGRSREMDREPVMTQRRPIVAPSRHQHERTGYQPLEERAQQPIFPEKPLDERWDEPGHNAEFDIRDLIMRQDDLLDMSIALAPDLPRMCQTCRDFRPSESGERGWCTNDWAFTHRQMVNAESLPCQSSIGCWWLPNDASWLPAFDPAERRSPTPRTDRLVARNRPDEIYADQEDQGLYVREI